MHTLSKREKKVAREIIEKGLQKEFAKSLYDADGVLLDWKEKKTDNRAAYDQLYKTIAKADKHIARRYDGMTGSKYIFIIAAQLADEIITQDDLKEFNEQTREVITNLSRI